MVRIPDIIAANKRGFSLEILPPQRWANAKKDSEAIDELVKKYGPLFLSVTYHQEIMERTRNALGIEELHPRKIRANPDLIAAHLMGRYNHLNVEVMPHFICGDFTQLETEGAVIQLPFVGIENIFLIRGDPNYGDMFKPNPQGHKYSLGMVEQIAAMRRKIYLNPPKEDVQPIDLCIGVAAYPERHYAAPNIECGIQYLKMKQDAGANFAITQMCFDTKMILQFIAMARDYGVTIPIIPGLKILDHPRQTGGESSVPAKMNVSIPDKLCKDLEKRGAIAGEDWMVEQMEELYANGVNDIHIYTLNRAVSTKRVLERVGFMPNRM